MSGVTFPASRTGGRALVVGGPTNRPEPVALLQQLNFTCAEVDDPYAAAAELLKRPLVYRALVISLASVFREELALIALAKRKFPHIDVWLTHTDGRQAALAEAMRLGADGLLAEDGLHRTAVGAPAEQVVTARREEPRSEESTELRPAEPVLTADELRALLQEQPTLPGDDA